MVSSGTGDEYYERAWLQIGSSISAEEEERIGRTLSLIPEHCASILDVGCGDGRLTNRLLSRNWRVVGLERSRTALKSVKSARMVGSAACLPFANASFELVLCCEVLEHLPFDVYSRAIAEIERVAEKHILVTVPNSEDLSRAFITCPQCGCTFHPARHVRSFNQDAAQQLFCRFRLQAMDSCSSMQVYPGLIVRGAERVKLLPPESFPLMALCPQCGYYALPPGHGSGEHSPGARLSLRDSRSARIVRSVGRRLIPTKRRWRWLMALYRRE